MPDRGNMPQRITIRLDVQAEQDIAEIRKHMAGMRQPGEREPTSEQVIRFALTMFGAELRQLDARRERELDA